ncbi:MAG: rhodanese-related sulfurtransferase [Bacteriovoracaceae bacterium]|jgi:rhodanese-related sulfurtransferase
MKKLLTYLFTFFIAMSCIDPQSAAKNKRKSVEVMADQISSKFPKAPQLSIEEFLKLKEDQKPFVLVDVRELRETKVSILPGSITKAEYEKEKDKYKNYTVIAYCTIGYRSSEYVQGLVKEDINAFNLKESLLGWAHRGLTFTSKGTETKKAHVYEEAWNFLPKGYTGVTD